MENELSLSGYISRKAFSLHRALALSSGRGPWLPYSFLWGETPLTTAAHLGRTRNTWPKVESLEVLALHSNTTGSLKCEDTQRASLLLRVTSDGKNGNWTLWISLAGHKPRCRQGKVVDGGWLSPVGRQTVCWQVSQLSELYQYPWLRDQRRLQ